MRRNLFAGHVASAAATLVVVAMLGMLAGTASPAMARGPGYFPNVPLVTQEGETVLFYDDLIKDKRVLINFMYETCEKACPLATAKMAQIQKALGDRIGRDIFMYSITLEPEHDTPEVLKAYAERFGAGPGWLFLTGMREDIDAVRYKLGERAEEAENHNNVLRIGDDPKHYWMQLPLFGDLEYLVNEVGKTLDPNWYAGKPVKPYEDVLPVRSTAPLAGQLVFQNKCSACHTIGNGDRIGPDLRGVTARREHRWLTRFISYPDLMRSLQDPIAVELAAKYSVAPMPNLELTKNEVADLIEYLTTEDRRLDSAGTVEDEVDVDAEHDPERGEKSVSLEN